MPDSSTTKLLIQDNINKIMRKTTICDATIVDDIAFASAVWAVANYTGSISEEEARSFSGKIKQYLDYFPKRCSCKEL